MAFLIIFCFLSLVTFTLFIVALQLVFSLGSEIDVQHNGLFGGSVVGLIALAFGVICFIDFLTLGFFKRNRFTARIDYPLYRLMGWITLSSLYRPLYHNLVDNRFGRRFARLLPVVMVLALLAVSIQFIDAPYFPAYTKDGLHAIEASNYDDLATDLFDVLRKPSLRTKYATTHTPRCGGSTVHAERMPYVHPQCATCTSDTRTLNSERSDHACVKGPARLGE